MGRGAEEPVLCDPGSELRLGGRDNRRAKIINGMKKHALCTCYWCWCFCLVLPCMCETGCWPPFFFSNRLVCQKFAQQASTYEDLDVFSCGGDGNLNRYSSSSGK